MKRFTTIILCAGILIGFISCDRGKSPEAATKPIFAATSPAIAMIIASITGDAAKVEAILSPTSSPHTYSSTPGDISLCSKALAIFYADEAADGWAAKIDSKKAVRMMSFLHADSILRFENAEGCGHDHSGHNHEDHGHDCKHVIEGVDPHFWTDPGTVKSILNKILDTICSLDPKNRDTYASNAKKFSAELDSLDAFAKARFEPYRGKSVFLFHPSFLYVLRRYGLVYGGSIETSPGKEASPGYIKEIVEKIRNSGAKAIYSEPQLSPTSAKVIAESAGVSLLELDPTGGSEGRKTYSDYFKYNVEAIIKGF